MQGTIRSYDVAAEERCIARTEKICKEIASGMDCRAEVSFDRTYPAVINHKTETEHIKRLGAKWFGPQHLSEDDLPISGSEDFSFFLQERPGCFFTLGTRKEGTPLRTVHTSDYNFNDDMVATAGYFYIRILEDRLGIKILK